MYLQLFVDWRGEHQVHSQTGTWVNVPHYFSYTLDIYTQV